MKLNVVKTSAFALALLFAGILPQAASAQAQWSFGYWTGYHSDPYTAIQWNGLTHLGFQTIFVNSNGTLSFEDINGTMSTGTSTWGPWATSIISAAHSNGVKVELALNVSTGAGWVGATSPGTLSTFVSNLMSVVNTYSFDGIDLDWESSINYTQEASLISSLRSALGSKLLTASMADANISFWAGQISNLDRIMVQTYDEAGTYSYSWFNAPLYSDSGTSTRSVNSIVHEFTAAGVSAAKICLGIPFYGYTFGGVSGPRQTGYSITGTPNYYQFAASYNISSPTFDSTAEVPWIAISGGYLSFDNAQSIADKVNYAKSNGLGGWMIWTVDQDYMSGQSPAHPLLAAVATAMGGGGGGSPPTISSFTASPTSISSGSSSTLSWSTSGATSLVISNGVGTVTGTSTSVSPTTTTTYTLSAINSYGTSTKTATVTVGGGGSAPTISSFSCSPSTISSGSSSTCSWSEVGATSLSINNGVGTVTGSSKSVSPTTTTTYTLTAANSVGSATKSATVTVVAAVLPTISSFTASPTSITAGASATLSWAETGASSLSINNGVGTVTGSTSHSVSPGATTTYILTATNGSGSVTKSVTVTVTPIQSLMAWPNADNWWGALVNVTVGVVSYMGNLTNDKLATDLEATGVDYTSPSSVSSATSAYATARTTMLNAGIITGNYISGTTVMPIADQSQFPYGEVPEDDMPGTASYCGSWPGQATRLFVCNNDAATMTAFHSLIKTQWTNYPAQIHFVDNAASEEGGSEGSQSWASQCANMAAINSIANSLGARAVFNISAQPGLIPSGDLTLLISSIPGAGIAFEQPWDTNVQGDPTLTATAVSQYRQILNAGIAVVMVQDAGSANATNSQLKTWVETWRHTGDPLYLSQIFFETADPTIFFLNPPQPPTSLTGAVTISGNVTIR